MMDNKQLALKVTLDVLGEDSDISTVNDRMRVQKAIYLAQVLGLNLGYHYSWYVKGPYSPGLTQDYYGFSEAVAGGDTSHANRTLNPGLLALIPRIQQVIARPQDVTVPRERWLEALASLHFLICTSGYTVGKAREYLSQVKPHLNNIFDRALSHLADNELIS